MTLNAVIIPLSVPTSPIIGPNVPSTANMLIFFSISTVTDSPTFSIASRASANPFGSSAIPVERAVLKKELSSFTTPKMLLKSRCSSSASQRAMISGGMATIGRISMNKRLIVATK